MDAAKLKEIETEYYGRVQLAREFCDSMARELNSLVINNNVALATPIERRVKALASIYKKIEGGRITNFASLNDFVGLRIVVLFQRDLEVIHKSLSDRFHIHKHEDTGGRLSDSEFGYRSVHYVVGIRDHWLGIPSWEKMGAQRCEIQVRTMAQHIWAAASHKLQYKDESNVPAPLRRAINRVSALLETVDLEFERVLNSRDDYRAEPENVVESLNVENLGQVLDQSLPAANKDEFNEDYADLLTDLMHFNVKTVGDLKTLVNGNLAWALMKDKLTVADKSLRGEASPDRIARGVFFTHVGLARWCLEKANGTAWLDYMMNRMSAKPTSSQRDQ
jgi:putative GTP pyrophosphokinase